MNTPAWQLQCYGCLETDMRASIEDSFTFKTSGPAMIAMSLLSDAQEELEHGAKERARQTINRAKWVIGEYVMKKASTTVNGVEAEAFERHAQALHELMCQGSMIRCAAGWSFNGWTADGRPVRHRITIDGYERSGPKVEAERTARTQNPPNPENPSR